MSRLYDRIMAFGCQPMYSHHLATADAYREIREAMYQRFVEDHHSDFANPADLEAAARYASSHQGFVSSAPRSVKTLDRERLRSLPVIAADDVGAYCADLPTGEPIQETLSSVAPPFDRFFVEIQKAPNSLDLHAWGLLIGQTFRDREPSPDSEIGWHLAVELIIEREKNKPIGPVVEYVMALDREGRLIENPGEPGKLVSAIILPEMTEEPPAHVQQDVGDRMMPYVRAGLMAVSFMHCRNVGARTVEPDERRSRKWERKRGEPLTRYEVLEIQPLREILDSKGQAQTKGLGHALHVCRGHFKTFSEDAPLFGRTTGTFWWANQVRGKSSLGEVVKDFNILAPETAEDIGRDYVEASEGTVIADAEHTGPDPDAAGRGLAAHNRTQNLLASHVEGAGLRPRSPSPDEPRYDLAWAQQGLLYVAEVKSVTERNEERQLRIALGQVVRYRQQLGTGGARPDVQAVIAIEREPDDPTWLDLCNDQGVILCWPDTMPLVFAEAA